MFLVIEMDLPYNNSQAAQYGESFAAMGQEKFESLVGSIFEALPYAYFSIVVSCVVSEFC